MTLWQAVILGIVQGITEFLPISSSAHLALFPWILRWRDPGLAFDVALHWGTLAAVLAYFRREWWAVGAGVARAVATRQANHESRLAAKLAIGTVPAAIAGVLVEDAASGVLRSPWIIAGMLASVAALLWALDRRARPGAHDQVPGWGAALLIGVAQAIALVPGTSRSGITMAAGLWLGLSRPAAARFSFLLAAPITFGAGLLQLDELQGGAPALLVAGILASAVSGALAIAFLLRYLARGSFRPFALYRFALAALVVGLLLWRGEGTPATGAEDAAAQEAAHEGRLTPS
jgi:undecaprenyl-diphosphatase